MKTRREEFENVLRLLSELSEREKALLQDEYQRLFYSRRGGELATDIEFGIRELISLHTQFKNLQELHQAYMTNKNRAAMERAKAERDGMIQLINGRVDEIIQELKVVFHNLLSEKEVADIQHLIDEQKKKVAQHKMIELHDYKGMHAILKKLGEAQAVHVRLPPEAEEETNKLLKLLKNIRTEVKTEFEITHLDTAIKETLEKFRIIIEEQSNMLRAQIQLLSELKIKKADDLFEGLKLNIKYSNILASLQRSIEDMRKNLEKEKIDVFDVLNHFMKKKRSVESIFEYLVEENKKGLLDKDDVSKMIATLSSIDEAFEFLVLLIDYLSFFDKEAQKMIREEIKYYGELMRSVKKEARLAFIDPLTGIPNKRVADQKQNELAEYIKTNPNTILSIIVADIDFFKAFNEVYGHRGGDIVLRAIAAEMNRLLRKGTDTLCRTGGEEFTIFLKDTNLDGAKVVAEKIRKRIEDLDIPYFGVAGEKHRKYFWQEGMLRIIKNG
ncbi:MAG: diguanylate cyclase, partial [Nanoarchaeota archaeon]|nr:diguanylate cyclase [Nanoarchaeota archaeon]